MKKKLFFILRVACVMVLAAAGYHIFVYYTQKHFSALRVEEEQRAIALNRMIVWAALQKAVSSELGKSKVTASVVIRDLDIGWEVAIGKDELIPSASMVKIPIMLGVFNAAQEGKICLQDGVVLKRCHKVSGSGGLKNKSAGGAYSVRRLVELMVCESDNTATNMLIDLLGMDYLNDFFKTLGLSGTNVSRMMMDFSKRSKGVENYTTARDIALALEKIYKNEFLNSAVSQECLGILKRQRVKDRIPSLLPPETVVAHKTGLEQNVCHDAGIIFTDTGDLLICVLTKGEPDSKTAKKLIAHVALRAFTYYRIFQEADAGAYAR